MCRWHTNKAPTGAAAETRAPPRVFGFFLRVEKETTPPRAVAAKKKLDEIIIKYITEEAERKREISS